MIGLECLLCRIFALALQVWHAGDGFLWWCARFGSEIVAKRFFGSRNNYKGISYVCVRSELR